MDCLIGFPARPTCCCPWNDSLSGPDLPHPKLHQKFNSGHHGECLVESQSSGGYSSVCEWYVFHSCGANNICRSFLLVYLLQCFVVIGSHIPHILASLASAGGAGKPDIAPRSFMVRRGVKGVSADPGPKPRLTPPQQTPHYPNTSPQRKGMGMRKQLSIIWQQKTGAR